MSSANVQTQNMEMSACKLIYKGQDLGGTLGNVSISVKYHMADIKADQSGDTIRDKRVTGLEAMVTTEIAEIKNKALWNILFPPSTNVIQNPDPIVASVVSPLASVALADLTVVLVSGSALTGYTAVVAGDYIEVYQGDSPVVIGRHTVASIVAGGLKCADVVSSAPSINLSFRLRHVNLSPPAVLGTAIEFRTNMGDSQIAKAGVLIVHPLSRPDSDTSSDYTFFLATATADAAIGYGPKEQSKMKVTFHAFPDASTTPERMCRYGDITF